MSLQKIKILILLILFKLSTQCYSYGTNSSFANDSIHFRIVDTLNLKITVSYLEVNDTLDKSSQILTFDTTLTYNTTGIYYLASSSQINRMVWSYPKNLILKKYSAKFSKVFDEYIVEGSYIKTNNGRVSFSYKGEFILICTSKNYCDFVFKDFGGISNDEVYIFVANTFSSGR